MIERAKELLRRSLYREAVFSTHQASASRPATSMLNAMLDVHIKAAQGLDRPPQYSEAIQILMCASSHDPTNAAVRAAVALRHLQHAKAVLEADPEAARKAAAQAARFTMEPQEALALLDRLNDASHQPE